MGELSLVKSKKMEYNVSWKDGTEQEAFVRSVAVVFLLRRCMSLEDMIARIVEMDKKARDMTEQAQKNKLDYENQIIAKRESIKNDFLERAKKRIAINQESAQKRADATLQQAEKRNSAIIQKMESDYAQHCDSWVDEIVERVIAE